MVFSPFSLLTHAKADEQTDHQAQDHGDHTGRGETSCLHDTFYNSVRTARRGKETGKLFGHEFSLLGYFHASVDPVATGYGVVTGKTAASLCWWRLGSVDHVRSGHDLFAVPQKAQANRQAPTSAPVLTSDSAIAKDLHCHHRRSNSPGQAERLNPCFKSLLITISYDLYTAIYLYQESEDSSNRSADVTTLWTQQS
jgi:hypothetical protein